MLQREIFSLHVHGPTERDLLKNIFIQSWSFYVLRLRNAYNDGVELRKSLRDSEAKFWSYVNIANFVEVEGSMSNLEVKRYILPFDVTNN